MKNIRTLKTFGIVCRFSHTHSRSTFPKAIINSDPNIIQFGSDLHTECNKSILIRPIADTLLLGGDIGNPFDPNYKNLLEMASNSFKSTYIVAGNHEYHYLKEWREMEEVEEEIQSICKKLGNVHFLQNSVKKLESGINIFGATLWTYIPPHYSPGYDNAKICKNGKNLTNNDINEMNAHSIQCIKTELDRCNKSQEKLLVLTHHPPSFLMQDVKYKNTPNSMRFYNGLDHLFTYPLVGWVCGHTHTKMIKKINGIQCAINAHGYAHENEKKTLLSHTITLKN